MRVDLATIACRSAFDLPTGRSSVLECPVDVLEHVRIIELRDVLYLPSVLDLGQSLCVVEGAFVPTESVLDGTSVTFLRDVLQRRPTRNVRYAGDFTAEVFDDPVCVLGNLFSRNFGHWTEELLKVAILEKLKIGCQYVVSDLPPFARSSLAFLGIEENRLLSPELPVIFSRVLFTTAVSHQNLSQFPSVLFELRRLVESRLDTAESDYSSRLWLERGAMLRNGGVTVNKEEVYRLLERHGFDIVDLATLSVPDQLRSVRHATTICGPHGAQFVHAQFMPASSQVIECFSPTHVNPSILEVCRVLRHSYHQIVSRSHLIAPYGYGRDCLVDCEHLSLVLDSL